MRMVVVRNKDNSVSCLPMRGPLFRYEKHDIVTIVNKPWNVYYSKKIKNYFNRRNEK